MANPTQLSLKELNEKLDKIVENSVTKSDLSELNRSVNEQLSGLETRTNKKITSTETEFNRRLRLSTSNEQIKEQVKNAVEDEADEILEGFRSTKIYRLSARVGAELKPGLPNHDHLKGSTITVLGLGVSARYVPFVREAVINLITP